MLVLRPYQEELIVGARQHFRAGRKRVLLQLATGGGKTAICARMLHNAASRNKRVWFCVHRRELVKQVSAALTKEGVEHGLVTSDGRMNLDAPAQVCSIPTLINRLDRLPPPDLIGWDECHHIAAGSWAKIMERFKDAYHIGLSATPQRLDGLGLANYFDAMVCGPSVKWLIDKEFLSRYELYKPDSIDRASLRKRAGEFVAADAERATQAIVGNAVSHYRRHIDGAKALLFAVSVKKSKEVASAFNDAGIPAMHIDSDTHDEIRDGVLEDFQAGKIKVITNVNLFSEGFDCPSLDAVIDIAPTMSMAMYRQRVGRMLRPWTGKDRGYYLDCVNNWTVHGRPDDDIEWELTTGTAAKKKPAVAAPRVCQYCFTQTPAGRPKCRLCRRPFPISPRSVEEIEGELTKADLEIRAQNEARRDGRMEQGMARDLESLIRLGKMRGMGNPEGWARHVLESRAKKKGKAA